MNQMFCYLVAWILELHWIGCLLQTRPPRRVFWYLAILFSPYTYKGHGPLKPVRVPLGVHRTRLGTTGIEHGISWSSLSLLCHRGSYLHHTGFSEVISC